MAKPVPPLNKSDSLSGLKKVLASAFDVPGSSSDWEAALLTELDAIAWRGADGDAGRPKG